MKFVTIVFMAMTGFGAWAADDGGGHHRDNSALFPPKKADPSMATAPAPVKIEAPSFMAKVSGESVDLTWSAAEGADTYHVQVATDANFKWLTINDYGVKTNSYKAGGLAKGKHYYWRVAPWKTGNMAATNKGAFTGSVFVTE